MSVRSNKDWASSFSTQYDYHLSVAELSVPMGSHGRKVYTKTNYLVLVTKLGSRGGPYSIAYQAWAVKGTGYSDSVGSVHQFYVRRGGSFTIKSGAEYFVPYGSMGSSQLYAARRTGVQYVNVGNVNQFKATVDNLLANEVGLNQSEINTFWKTYDVNSYYQFGLTENDLEFKLKKLFPDKFPDGGPPLVIPDPTTSTGGGGGGGGGGGKKDTPKDPPLPRPEIKIVTRMPKGYLGRASRHGSKPQMVQRYRSDKDKNGDPREDDTVFTFDYVPQGIKYSGLAGEWVEIPRAEDVPFVDWARWQLMKVSFSFIIANNITVSGGRTVPDGLETSVDRQILQLRKMAQRKLPVMLFNFDDMLSVQLRRANLNVELNKKGNTKPNMEFVITDLSITATRRTSGEDGGPSSPSDIAVAQVEITLTEIPVEVIGIVALPPIESVAISPPGKKTGGPTDLKYLPDTDYLAPKDSSATTTGND